MDFAKRPKGLFLHLLGPERPESAAIGHAQKGVTGRNGHENAGIKERREARHGSLPPRASQSLGVVRHISVVEAIVIRLAGHFVETASSLFSLAIPVREDIMKSQSAVPGLPQTLKGELVFVQEPHQSIATDPQE
ncbi:MAG: hypothetical protein K0S37_1949 [Microbacterium sp.]|nr:hypothetical protein [Microbacterium sp.]